MKPRRILGISAYYHDSAACLLIDGKIRAAAQEERFTRRKHDAGFPAHAARYCLNEAGLRVEELDYVVFYDKPLLKFERLLETYLTFAPRGLRSFMKAMPEWIHDKLLLRRRLRSELRDLDPTSHSLPVFLFNEHHESHAASAFFPSPYEEAAILCADGVGEWATTSAWRGSGNKLEPLWELHFPHSLGLLYSAFTYYTGFKVNSGEYKVMGLAPYGRPSFVKHIYDNLLDLKADGTFRLNLDYFDYCTGLRMTNRKFDALFDGPPRPPDSPLRQKDMDLARSIQEVTEEVMLRMVRALHAETGCDSLCMAGGVSLNAVANGRILREGPFRNVWVQPAAGDAGGAIGAALSGWYQFEENPRLADRVWDSLEGTFLGPSYSSSEVSRVLDSLNAPYRTFPDAELADHIAEQLACGKVVAWFHGRMEFGPRALGARSILADPRIPEMQSILNLKIKFRESFRPFAPAVLEERVSEYFELDHRSPYMLFVALVERSQQEPLPAVTHVDGSARIQTVDAGANPRFHSLLRAFEKKTGCGVLVNTSFNVRGEPIVCTPEDAYRCFMSTGIDLLAIENHVVAKTSEQQMEVHRLPRKFELD